MVSNRLQTVVGYIAGEGRLTHFKRLVSLRIPVNENAFQGKVKISVVVDHIVDLVKRAVAVRTLEKA